MLWLNNNWFGKDFKSEKTSGEDKKKKALEKASIDYM